MQRSMTKRRIVSSAPIAAIALRSVDATNPVTRVGTWLVIYMRLIALIWLGEGLVQWWAVFLSQADGGSALAALPLPTTVAVVFFAIIDLIAAVGLWLAAPWGGVIWLVAAGVQLYVLLAMPGFYEHPAVMAAVGVVLVLGYFLLTWLVARSQERPA